MLWWTLRQLKSKDSMIRVRAAGKLGDSRNREAMGPLVATLQDEDWEVRATAAKALGVIGDTNVIGPLTALLIDQNSSVRRDTAKALDALHWHPEDDTQRALRAIALGEWSEVTKIGPSVVKLLVELLNDQHDDVRQGAVAALGEIGEGQVMELLISALDSQYNDVRSGAAEALGKVGDKRVVARLLSAVEDKSERVRAAAVEALRKIDPNWTQTGVGDAVIQGYLSKLNSNDSDERKVAVEVLVKIGHATIEPLVVQLQSSEKGKRERAADVLDLLGWQPASLRAIRAISRSKWVEVAKMGVSAVEPLIWAYTSDRSVRRAALEALGKIDDTHAVEPLVTALGHDSDDVRLTAAGVLAKLGWQPATTEQRAYYAVALKEYTQASSKGIAAVRPLLWVIRDSGYHYDDRDAAKAALCRIKDPLAVEPLLMALQELIADRSDDALAVVVTALGALGDAKAIGPLMAVLQNEDSMSSRMVRKEVAVALGTLGDTRIVKPLVARIKGSSVKSAWEAEPRQLVESAWEAEPGLRQLLEKAATNISLEDLEMLADLKDVSAERYYAIGCDIYSDATCDCSQIRQLARQELIRRGLKG